MIFVAQLQGKYRKNHINCVRIEQEHMSSMWKSTVWQGTSDAKALCPVALILEQNREGLSEAGLTVRAQQERGMDAAKPSAFTGGESRRPALKLKPRTPTHGGCDEHELESCSCPELCSRCVRAWGLVHVRFDGAHDGSDPFFFGSVSTPIEESH